MLSWPSSQRMRYRGERSPRNTSSTTPERGRRLVDSDSATTRLPTSKAMLTSDRSCLLWERVAAGGLDHLAGLGQLAQRRADGARLDARFVCDLRGGLGAAVERREDLLLVL